MVRRPMAMLQQWITPNDMEHVVRPVLYSGNVTTKYLLTTMKMKMLTMLATVEERGFEVGEARLQLQVIQIANMQKKCCRHQRRPHHQSFYHHLHHQLCSILTKQTENRLIMKLPRMLHMLLPSLVPIPALTQKRTLKALGWRSPLEQHGVQLEENQSSQTATLKTDTVAVVVLSTGLEIRDDVLCIIRRLTVMWTMMREKEDER